MDTRYHLQARLTLEPVMWQEAPLIKVGLDEKVVYDGFLDTITQYVFDDMLSMGDHRIWINFLNKKDSDTQSGKDKAVKVSELSFFSITSPRFVWQGTYEPIYPQGWIDQLKAQDLTPQPRLHHHDYLSWNGTWFLEFSMPIFTWIHNVEYLGWIYD